MVTHLKPNHQAPSLYTEKDSYNPSAQASEADQQLRNQPVDIKEIFPGMTYIQTLAKKVKCQIKVFLSRTLQSIIEIGNCLKEIESEIKNVFGSKGGEARFKQWLSSPEGIGSPEVALSMMEITSWYNDLQPGMQRLIINKTQTWSFSALKRLRGLSNELIKQLIKEKKQTVKSIERAIATSLASELAPLPAEEGSRPVTPSDWSNLRERFNLRPRHIKVLKQKAESLASPSQLATSTPPVVKVSHVNEAIAQCKEDPELLNQPAKKAKKNKIDPSTPAESPLQDNSDEAITELIASAIADDMEKEQAANSRTIALLQQTIAEKDAAIAAQKEQINSAIAGEREKAARVHQEQMESLRQTLGVQSPPVEGMYTQEQLDEAVEKKIADAYKNMYTDEEVQEEIEFELKKERIKLKKEFDSQIAEALASREETANTASAEKIASLQQTLAEKDQALASMSEQTEAAVAQARADERKKTASAMAEQIAELQQTMAELQQTLAEKDRALASLKEQQAAASAEKVASLQKELAEKDKAIALMEEEKVAAVASARAACRASVEAEAVADIEVLQREIESLKAQNHSLMATSEQLVTATWKVEELKSQLADTEGKYQEKVKWLEADLNTVVASNQSNGRTLKLLEEANESMHNENRSLKEELAGYKNIETKIQSNYSKIALAENLQKENALLKKKLQGQTDKSVLLASRVNQLSGALCEVHYMQKTLANLEIPGFENNGENYICPVDGQTYQGIRGLAKFFQDLVNNNFNLATA